MLSAVQAPSVGGATAGIADDGKVQDRKARAEAAEAAPRL